MVFAELIIIWAPFNFCSLFWIYYIKLTERGLHWTYHEFNKIQLIDYITFKKIVEFMISTKLYTNFIQQYMYNIFIKKLSSLFESKLLKCWISDSPLTKRIVLHSLWFKLNPQIYEIFINIIECRIHSRRKLAIYTLKSIPLNLQKLYFHVF